MQKLWELPRRITPHPTMVEGMPGGGSALQPRRHQKSNGVSEPDEVIPLSELGIGALSHHYEFRESKVFSSQSLRGASRGSRWRSVKRTRRRTPSSSSTSLYSALSSNGSGSGWLALMPNFPCRAISTMAGCPLYSPSRRSWFGKRLRTSSSLLSPIKSPSSMGGMGWEEMRGSYLTGVSSFLLSDQDFESHAPTLSARAIKVRGTNCTMNQRAHFIADLQC